MKTSISNRTQMHAVYPEASSAGFVPKLPLSLPQHMPVYTDLVAQRAIRESFDAKVLQIACPWKRSAVESSPTRHRVFGSVPGPVDGWSSFGPALHDASHCRLKVKLGIRRIPRAGGRNGLCSAFDFHFLSRLGRHTVTASLTADTVHGRDREPGRLVLAHTHRDRK